MSSLNLFWVLGGLAVVAVAVALFVWWYYYSGTTPPPPPPPPPPPDNNVPTNLAVNFVAGTPSQLDPIAAFQYGLGSLPGATDYSWQFSWQAPPNVSSAQYVWSVVAKGGSTPLGGGTVATAGANLPVWDTQRMPVLQLGTTYTFSVYTVAGGVNSDPATLDFSLPALPAVNVTATQVAGPGSATVAHCTLTAQDTTFWKWFGGAAGGQFNFYFQFPPCAAANNYGGNCWVGPNGASGTIQWGAARALSPDGKTLSFDSAPLQLGAGAYTLKVYAPFTPIGGAVVQGQLSGYSPARPGPPSALAFAGFIPA